MGVGCERRSSTFFEDLRVPQLYHRLFPFGIQLIEKPQRWYDRFGWSVIKHT